MSRRAFASTTLAALASVSAKGIGAPATKESPVIFSHSPRAGRETKDLLIGCLVFPDQDQIDFTGPFEVFSRISNTKICVIGKSTAPVRDVKGLVLTPDTSLAQARE